MLFASASIFSYYTLWTLVTPFFEPDSAIQNYFPDREWAVRIPAVALLFFMAAIAGLVSLVLLVHHFFSEFRGYPADSVLFLR